MKDYKRGFFTHQSYSLKVKIPIQIQKGKSVHYNIANLNLASIPLKTKYNAPMKVPDLKFKNIQNLLPYVPFPWSNYFVKMLNKQPNGENYLDGGNDELENDQLEY